MSIALRSLEKLLVFPYNILASSMDVHSFGTPPEKYTGRTDVPALVDNLAALSAVVALFTLVTVTTLFAVVALTAVTPVMTLA